MKIRLGGRPWLSLKKARESAMCVLDEGAYMTDALLDGAYRLVRDLLDLHSHSAWFLSSGAVRKLRVEEEYGRSVIAAYVGAEPRRFWFSLKNCKLHMPSVRSRLVRLMRRAISDQIAEFKAVEIERQGANSPYCQICHEPIARLNDIHVDHEIFFCNLVDDFLTIHATPDLDQPVPASWIAAWQEFHKDRAVLRLTHAACNELRGSGERGIENVGGSGYAVAWIEGFAKIINALFHP